MPERTTYDEAMLLSQARLKVQDQDLKQGQVETITLQTNVGSMKRPWGIQGGFAVVYKYSTQSGKRRALRCFLIGMDPDIAYRYERIGAYFAAHAPNIAVEFKYYESGILLKEVVYGQTQNKTYPIIEMEWIEGATLIEYIDELCQKRDVASLAKVIKQWENIMATLQKASISHGDLAGVNVMVRSNGQLVLVDYDGVYIPDFAGLDPIVLGQADYQHPQMALRSFNERTDDFSAWVIYTALLALQLLPELWSKYTYRNAQGKLLDTHLLFKKDDFSDPDQSPLFAELAQINDTSLRKALQILKQACKRPVTNVPPFDPGQIDPDAEKKQALAKLEQAIQNNDDEEIVKTWVPQLENYGPAQQYVTRVAQAKQVLQALKRLQDALQTHSVQKIAAAYDPIINNSKQLIGDQGEQLLLALTFAIAYQTDDDQAMVHAWENIESSRFKGILTLTGQEQQRLSVAYKRKEALVQFRLALMKKNIQPLVASYDPSLLDTYKVVTARERELLRVAQDFAQAYQSDDDQAIVAASEAIQNFSYRADFNFTTQEKQRIGLAQQRKIALVKFRMGLMSKNMRQMIASYDWILDDCTSITKQERDLLRMAKAFVQATYRNDDEALVNAWETIQKASYQQFFTLSVQEQERINKIRQGKTLLPKFRQALASKKVQQIVADYDGALDNDTTITQEERNLLRLARNFMQAYQSDDDQMLATVWEEIQEPHYRQAFIFTEQERQRAELAQQRKVALMKFRLAIMSKRVQQIVAAYSPILDGCRNVTASEQKQLMLASQLLHACQREDDKAIAAAWAAIQSSPYQKSFVLTESEMQRITLAQSRKVK